MNTQEKIVSFMQFQMPLIAWSLFIFVASSIPMPRLPSLENYSDKMVHAGVYFVLCWLSHVAFFFQKNQFVKKYALVFALIFVVFYGASDEYHQMFTPGRSTDPYDLIADTFGGLVYVLLHRYFQIYRNE